MIRTPAGVAPTRGDSVPPQSARRPVQKPQPPLQTMARRTLSNKGRRHIYIYIYIYTYIYTRTFLLEPKHNNVHPNVVLKYCHQSNNLKYQRHTNELKCSINNHTLKHIASTLRDLYNYTTVTCDKTSHHGREFSRHPQHPGHMTRIVSDPTSRPVRMRPCQLPDSSAPYWQKNLEPTLSGPSSLDMFPATAGGSCNG